MARCLLIMLCLLSMLTTHARQRTCHVHYPHTDRHAFEQRMQQWIAVSGQQRGQQTNMTRRIAVIVHVIHNGEPVGTGVNIPDDQIRSQIEALNINFQRRNADTVNLPSVFHGVGAALNIEFVPAMRNPQGAPLSVPGVHRVHRNTMLYDNNPVISPMIMDLYVKPATIWNPDAYLNVWVCNPGDNLLGYAVFPTAGTPDLVGAPDTPQLDGVVIHYRAFGTRGRDLYPDYNRGRTTVHEIGHFLGLYHIWGDDDGHCSDDDYCADTPLQRSYTAGCATEAENLDNSCVAAQFPAMSQNHMDYSDDRCLNIFTKDQVARMEAVLAMAPRRQSLIQNANTIAATLDDLLAAAVSIFPNPASDHLRVKVQDEWSSLRLRLINLSGQTLYQTDVTQSVTEIPVAQLGRGIYLLECISPHARALRKVLIQ